MIIIKKAELLSIYIRKERQQQKTSGFVPTMGALHQGHLSLVASSKRENDITVCSIFINPTQFNNADDFKYYPVTLESDIEKLVAIGCDVLFLPDQEEIYPAQYQQHHYELGNIEQVLEGFYRPGHFQGVCQVVHRLLQIVDPDRLYLGQKDFQQCLVIRKLLQLINKEDEVDLVIVPTIREADGLAMSSRNLRLSPEQRARAHLIFTSLNYIRDNIDQQPLDLLISKGRQLLEENGFIVDYVEVADAETLVPRRTTDEALVALIAATTGKIRLIDNMLLN